VLPTPPTDLTATGVAVPAINLTWTDNSNVEDGYEVLRSPVEVDYYTYVVIATLPPNSMAYHDAGVSANTRYWYYVRAKKDGGFTNQSNTASAIAATTLPTAPAGLDAIPTGSSAVSLIWSDNSSNEDGFRVERSVDGGATWQVAGTTGAELPRFWDNGRTSDQRLCYRVFAFNGLGVSAPSNTDCATPPAAPTNLVATTAADVAIDLTWTDNSSIEDGYDVWRQYCDYSYWEPYCYYVIVANLGPDATSYHDAGLNPGEAYTYVVTARKDGGYSDSSNEAWAFSTVPPAAGSNAAKVVTPP
jgi:titin